MSKLPEPLFQNTMWNQEQNSIWLGTILSLYRNFSLYKFPEKMTTAEMTGSLKAMTETFQKIPSLQSLQFLPANDLSLLDKEFLYEHFLCTQSLQETRTGQGFAFDSQNRFLTLHFHNHLQFNQMETSEDLVSAWKPLLKIDEELGRLQPYAFSPRFGYLTASPLTCGTALEARLLLHIPALRHTGALGELLRKLGDEQILFLSLEGELDDLVGDILILKNHYTLGVTEEATLSLLQAAALKLVLAEKEARTALKSKPSAELKDFVGRSFGLLTHSYQLHSKEALDGLSGLVLGAELGWISGVSPQKLRTLMLEQRRGHLSRLLGITSTDPQELSHKRAEWLHQQLKGITMTD